MRRREFFKAVGVLFGAPIGTTAAAAYVPLPDGRTIPVDGNSDAELIAKIRAEIAESNKEAMRQMQRRLERNLGPLFHKWNNRYGS